MKNSFRTSVLFGISILVSIITFQAHAFNPSKIVIGDVGVIGPKGEVILFYRNGDQIVIQECQTSTVLNSRTDCVTKPGTFVAHTNIELFKYRLKQILRLPHLKTNFDSNTQDVVDNYRHGVANSAIASAENLDAQRKQLKAAIARIQSFIKAYGEQNADLAGKAALEEKLVRVEASLNDLSTSVQAIRDVNRRVSTLVDRMISNPKLEKFVYSNTQGSLEFNMLRSYVTSPKIEASTQFVSMSSGTFLMGSPNFEANRWHNESQHTVTISKRFEIQNTEVTQAQWSDVMGTNPSYFSKKYYCPENYFEINGQGICPDLPVENVSFNDILIFINKLNESSGTYIYRLPTEAEWEASVRCATTSAYSFGNDVSELGDYAWYRANYTKWQTKEVALKKANKCHLHDMHGNVWEWVQDWYAEFNSANVVDPLGPSSGSDRVIRGGSWDNDADTLRSANREYRKPESREYNVGFRLVRTKLASDLSALATVKGFHL